MTNHDFLPNPERLGERLLSELDFLKDQNQDLLTNNSHQLESQYWTLKQIDFSDNWEFSIDPNWKFPLGGQEIGGNSTRDFAEKEGFAIIGGKVEVTDGSIEDYSFNLVILSSVESESRSSDGEEDINIPCCWNGSDIDSEYRVARRYHFDIDIGDTNDENKPVTHLQIGGKFNHGHILGQSPHYCLSPLDKPRIPYPPMDPALILHMLICQYSSLQDLQQDDWQSVVRETEQVLWEPYHAQIGVAYENDRIQQPFSEYINNGSV